MQGVVVCPQPLAAEAGAEVLAAGGNAFDAAIAAAFVQMAVDPHMCGLGGFGCATYATGGEVGHLAFHARSGGRATPDMWAGDLRGRMELGGYTLFDDHRSNLGHTSVGTPGVVAGLEALHRHARLPWAELLAPAAAICRQGFVVPDYLFELLNAFNVPGMPPGLERVSYTPDSRRLWCRPDGSLKRPGDRWENPDMADTLERLARHGARDFYAGELAQAMAAEIERGGGYVTLDDLKRYRVREGKPAAGTFRGLEVLSAPAPASGPTLLSMLRMLERPLPPGEPETLVALAAAMREAFQERARSLGDPDFLPSPAGTTHVSTADAAGNAVSLTHTLALYSGVIVPGTGISLNSAMDIADPIPGGPNSIAPGKARVSGMAPTIVQRGGRPHIVSGSPGTNAITTGVFQVIVNLVDGGMSPHEAVAAPRVHCEGGPVFIEGRISQKARALLTQRGFDVRPATGNYVARFGRVQLIVLGSDGRMTGASDPRRDGGVAAYAS